MISVELATFAMDLCKPKRMNILLFQFAKKVFLSLHDIISLHTNLLGKILFAFLF